MPTAKASVPTANAAKYVQQLCKHWSHRLEVDLSDRKGVVRFPSAVATLDAGEDALLVTIEGENADEVERLKGVVASHLDRFAFREAPLRFDWSRAEEARRRGTAMNADEIRAIQAPLKDRYRSDPKAGMLTLRAKGALDSAAIACKVETGRALAVAGLAPGDRRKRRRALLRRHAA